MKSFGEIVDALGSSCDLNHDSCYVIDRVPPAAFVDLPDDILHDRMYYVVLLYAGCMLDIACGCLVGT